MLSVNLAVDFQIREHASIPWQPTEWIAGHWRFLRERGVRVVFDNEKKIGPVIRLLCAHDVEVELLDVDKIRYGFVLYDMTGARRAMKLVKLPHMKPWIRWLSRSWALDAIGALT